MDNAFSQQDLEFNELFNNLDYNCVVANEVGKLLNAPEANAADKFFKEENVINFEQYTASLPSFDEVNINNLESEPYTFPSMLTDSVPKLFDADFPRTPTYTGYYNGTGLTPTSATGNFTFNFPFTPYQPAAPRYNPYGNVQALKQNVHPSRNNISDIEMLKQMSKIQVELEDNGGIEFPDDKKKSNTTMIYRCPWDGCDKTFGRFYNLKSHYRTHSGERPFTCDTCRASFARNHDLKRHQRVHSGSKPYACTICNKNFSRQDALNRHLNNHHRD
jgi:uncharacterized Zn-finger protein